MHKYVRKAVAKEGGGMSPPVEKYMFFFPNVKLGSCFYRPFMTEQRHTPQFLFKKLYSLFKLAMAL